MEHSFARNEDDDDGEESILERRERERADKENANGKAENEELIPLIPNVKLDVRKTIHEIQVWKIDPPGDGFKGTVSPHATIPSIAKLYGNGVYDFEAITQGGKTLRRNSGVKIAWQNPEPKSTPSPSTSGDAHMDLLKWQAEQHQRESIRTEAFGKMAVDSTRDMSKSQVDAVIKQQELTSARERDFFAGMMTQQQQFFQNMMLMTQQEHRLSSERSREDFNRTIQIIQTTSAQAAKASDPTMLLGLFQQGLALGSGMNEDDDDDEDGEASTPWVEAIKAAGEAVKDISEASKFKTIIAHKTQTNKAKAARQSQPPPGHTQTPPPPTQAAPASAVATPSKGKPKLPFQRSELKEMLRLKRIMDQKGLDFSQTLRNASNWIANGDNGGILDASGPNDGEETPDENDPVPSEPPEGDSNESPPADMEG
jgi:hypothetical protein